MLKVELHAHTADDPVDRHPAHQPRADRSSGGARLRCARDHPARTAARFAAAAFPMRPSAASCSSRVSNGPFKAGMSCCSISTRTRSRCSTFDDLARLKKRQRGLVVAPHPFFPSTSCLWGLLDRHRDLFDAVEYNAMFTASVNFNRAAERWAARHGKPLVGNGDVHRLHQLGTTYSLVDAVPDADAICAAIAEAACRSSGRRSVGARSPGRCPRCSLGERQTAGAAGDAAAAHVAMGRLSRLSA